MGFVVRAGLPMNPQIVYFSKHDLRPTDSTWMLSVDLSTWLNVYCGVFAEPFSPFSTRHRVSAVSCRTHRVDDERALCEWGLNSPNCQVQ